MILGGGADWTELVASNDITDRDKISHTAEVNDGAKIRGVRSTIGK